jgi:hypothetical protein
VKRIMHHVIGFTAPQLLIHTGEYLYLSDTSHRCGRPAFVSTPVLLANARCDREEGGDAACMSQSQNSPDLRFVAFTQQMRCHAAAVISARSQFRDSRPLLHFPCHIAVSTRRRGDHTRCVVALPNELHSSAERSTRCATQSSGAPHSYSSGRISRISR